MPPPTHVNEILPAVPASVAKARRLVGDFARASGATREQVDRVRLAVSEAFTNAVVHGYRGDEGEVGVTAAVADGELSVLVSDRGRGHQAPSDAPGLGWGLALIADASDQFVIAEASGGGTEVRMRFALRPAGGSYRRGSSPFHRRSRTDPAAYYA